MNYTAWTEDVFKTHAVIVQSETDLRQKPLGFLNKNARSSPILNNNVAYVTAFFLGSFIIAPLFHVLVTHSSGSSMRINSLFFLLSFVLLFVGGCGGSAETNVTSNQDELTQFLKENPELNNPEEPSRGKDE